MSDPFKSYATGLESPATHAYHVTPSDTEDLPTFCRALNVAVGGAVKVTTLGNEVVTLAVAEGSPFPLRCRRVWADGTTATGIVALY